MTVCSKRQHLLIGVVYLMGILFLLRIQQQQQQCNHNNPKKGSRSIAQPPPQHNNNNDASLPPYRFAEAVTATVRSISDRSYTITDCSSEDGIGVRPANHLERFMGNTCEPWINRQTLMVLDRFLSSRDGTRLWGLEWSSGSGTAWLLRKGLALHSVEHCHAWLMEIQDKLRFQQQPEEQPTTTTTRRQPQQWYPHHVARSDGKGCDQREPSDPEEVERIFGNYTTFPRNYLWNNNNNDNEDKNARRLLRQQGGFDFVSVDGRARDPCLLEATTTTTRPSNSSSSNSNNHQNHKMLLRPDYGLLLLDNAERVQYRVPNSSGIPSHWLAVSFVNPIDETVLWMSCPTVQDAACTAARRQVVGQMALVPRHLVGRRYTEHLQRARSDGVPGVE
mmetsp:Transcript_27152/g.74873  ORF Transcript_27152/g.74873 Transcript_27152/m.74873 type:complete len:391 (+) Transcript_27152:189-1361(+)